MQRSGDSGLIGFSNKVRIMVCMEASFCHCNKNGGGHNFITRNKIKILKIHLVCILNFSLKAKYLTTTNFYSSHTQSYRVKHGVKSLRPKGQAADMAAPSQGLVLAWGASQDPYWIPLAGRNRTCNSCSWCAVTTLSSCLLFYMYLFLLLNSR